MAMKDKLYFYLDTTVTIVHIHPILARQEPGTCIQLIQSQSQPQGVAQLRKTYLNHTEDKATYSRYLGVLELLSACMWYMLWTGLHGMQLHVDHYIESRTTSKVIGIIITVGHGTSTTFTIHACMDVDIINLAP